MLVLYINENSIKEQRNGEILYVNDKQIINPKDEDYINLGYKELIEDEQPEYNSETEYLEVLYEVKENNVLKHYEVKEIKEEEVA
jgi:hypothetical protein